MALARRRGGTALCGVSFISNPALALSTESEPLRNQRRRLSRAAMKIFIDSADVAELKALAETGLVDGVTTNPTLVAKSGGKIFDALKEICEAIPGPISAEVTATDYEGMLAEGRKLRTIAPNIVVKVPLTPDGLKACRKLESEGHPVNVTLCFSAPQA